MPQPARWHTNLPGTLARPRGEVTEAMEALSGNGGGRKREVLEGAGGGSGLGGCCEWEDIGSEVIALVGLRSGSELPTHVIRWELCIEQHYHRGATLTLGDALLPKFAPSFVPPDPLFRVYGHQKPTVVESRVIVWELTIGRRR